MMANPGNRIEIDKGCRGGIDTRTVFDKDVNGSQELFQKIVCNACDTCVMVPTSMVGTRTHEITQLAFCGPGERAEALEGPAVPLVVRLARPALHPLTVDTFPGTVLSGTDELTEPPVHLLGDRDGYYDLDVVPS